ncbi:MAG: ABC transporter substrate-binding protein [Saprospiraceae bacterium]|nr:ABC transporter substrate-binding protein [Saprospiraceae bacterium]
MHRIIFAIFLFLFFHSCDPPANEQSDPAELSWEEIETLATGTEVNLMMWQGDPLINDYMQQYVIPALRQRYEIELNIANGQGNTIVQILMAEMEAGKRESELDMMWINGETFYQLRQIDGLYGPWLDKLPNARFLDLDNPFIGIDFQQPIDGFECPWGNVQMALIYDSNRVEQPFQTRAEMADFVERHPGKFTFDTRFTGLTFLKSLLIDIAGGQRVLAGPFDEEKYQLYSARLWEYIRKIRPYLWKEGATFPEGVAPMHQMFANGELWYTMSNNDSEVDNKVLRGLFPKSARAYAPEFGTIQNSHYMGISRMSGNKAGAMVVCNFLISPEAQYRKQDPAVWGDGTVLAIERLPEAWQSRFADLPSRKYAPPREVLDENALMELAPEYMIRLAEDFRREIINR